MCSVVNNKHIGCNTWERYKSTGGGCRVQLYTHIDFTHCFFFLLCFPAAYKNDFSKIMSVLFVRRLNEFTAVQLLHSHSYNFGVHFLIRLRFYTVSYVPEQDP